MDLTFLNGNTPCSQQPQICALYGLVVKSWEADGELESLHDVSSFPTFWSLVSHDKVEKAHLTPINCLSSSKHAKTRVYKHVDVVFSCKPPGKKNEMISKQNAQPFSNLYCRNSNKSGVSVKNEKLTNLEFKGVCGPRAKHPKAAQIQG